MCELAGREPGGSVCEWRNAAGTITNEKKHPDMFGKGVVKFDQRVKVSLPDRAFVIVAAISERIELGRVMGKQYGRRPPVVVSNPVFVVTESSQQ